MTPISTQNQPVDAPSRAGQPTDPLSREDTRASTAASSSRLPGGEPPGQLLADWEVAERAALRSVVVDGRFVHPARQTGTAPQRRPCVICRNMTTRAISGRCRTCQRAARDTPESVNPLPPPPPPGAGAAQLCLGCRSPLCSAESLDSEGPCELCERGLRVLRVFHRYLERAPLGERRVVRLVLEALAGVLEYILSR